MPELFRAKYRSEQLDKMSDMGYRYMYDGVHDVMTEVYVCLRLYNIYKGRLASVPPGKLLDNLTHPKYF